MNPNEFVKLAARTRSPLPTEKDNIYHMLFGIMDELGELTKIYKANLAYNKEIDRANVKEEIGDLLWFIANLCDVLEINMEEVMTMCIEKLKVRYPQKYTDRHAVQRDLEAERKLIEELGFKGR